VKEASVQTRPAAPGGLSLPYARLVCDLRPMLMGVVNATPDSFSDGGALYPADGGGSAGPGHPEAAIAHGRRLLADGADVVDVGGESSRPGAEPVAEGEELARVVPVVEALAADGAVVSVDTKKPAVARAAVEAGAVLVNDVSGAADPELLAAVAESGAGYVLMHIRGGPADMQSRTDYDDVAAEVHAFLAEGLERCEHAGIPRERVAVDPGVGFAKTPEGSLTLLRSLDRFRSLGRPVLVGASRKSFLGKLFGLPLDGRLEGSLACVATAVQAGAGIVRVHDVAESATVARVAHAVASGETEWPEALDRG
jgi:dihydropteroate synthase